MTESTLVSPAEYHAPLDLDAFETTMVPRAARAPNRAQIADRHVGARIRERRLMLGMSQQQLAALIGVTCQQAHKYERGLNRIAAGRLYDIAVTLGVPVSWFFEGISDGPEPVMTPRQRMCLEVARNFAAIDNERYQTALSQMTRALAGLPGEGR